MGGFAKAEAQQTRTVFSIYERRRGHQNVADDSAIVLGGLAKAEARQAQMVSSYDYVGVPKMQPRIFVRMFSYNYKTVYSTHIYLAM